MVFSTPVYAATYEVDYATSKVAFKVRRLSNDLNGQFTRFRGAVEVDPKLFSPSYVDATIEVASMDTSDDESSDSVIRHKLFRSDKFPEITFKSKKVEKGKVIGDLTMRGVTREVVFDFVFRGIAKDPSGKELAEFSATTTLDRKDFGILFSRFFDRGGILLSNAIFMSIHFQAILKN